MRGRLLPLLLLVGLAGCRGGGRPRPPVANTDPRMWDPRIAELRNAQHPQGPDLTHRTGMARGLPDALR